MFLVTYARTVKGRIMEGRFAEVRKGCFTSQAELPIGSSECYQRRVKRNIRVPSNRPSHPKGLIITFRRIRRLIGSVTRLAVQAFPA